MRSDQYATYYIGSPTRISQPRRQKTRTDSQLVFHLLSPGGKVIALPCSTRTRSRWQRHPLRDGLWRRQVIIRPSALLIRDQRGGLQGASCVSLLLRIGKHRGTPSTPHSSTMTTDSRWRVIFYSYAHTQPIYHRLPSSRHKPPKSPYLFNFISSLRLFAMPNAAPAIACRTSLLKSVLF